ncbi:hypothetical protein SFRURICE_015241 [Spodoptera frugiperda]|nr:hypothetical protein SFRURICE_015241 [Spodoptera frugiperda]
MKDTVLLLLCAVALAHSYGRNPQQCNCDPSEESKKICESHNGLDDVLVAHEHCDKFYKCTNGKAVAYQCPDNLLYDAVAERCEWPHEVNCGNRPISDGNDCNGIDVSQAPPSSTTSRPINEGTCNCRPDEAPSICAANGSDGVLVAHENCNQFYKCDNEKPVALYCFGNLLYNPYTEQCDWPENVDCGDRVIPNPGQTPAPGPGPSPSPTPSPSTPGSGTCNCRPDEAPSICAVDGSDGVLVAHENCNQFYKCDNGKPVALYCFGNLLYNPYTEQCDWPENVDCGDRVIPNPGQTPAPGPGPSPSPTPSPSTPGSGTCNCRPDEAPSICAVDGSDGVLVAHENCNQFYKCDNGKPVALYCFGNLLYNPYTEQCDWPENVDCGDRVIPDPGQTPTPGPTPEPKLHLNQHHPTATLRSSEAPTICAADNSEGVLVAHENCNQYYICSGNKHVAQTCPGNLLFNPSKDQCDWPENVDCGDRVIPDPGQTPIPSPSPTPSPSTPGSGTCNCRPDEAPSICAVDGSDGVLVAHENCNQFYKCDNGKPVALYCFGNLLYNPYTEQCDWPENVDCGDRSDNCDPVIYAPTICAADNSEGVLVAHENCNQYYICSGNKHVAQTCPGNLLFNPSKDQCDWPENVDCGDRVIPDPGQTPIPPPSPTPSPSTPGSGTCNCRPDEAPFYLAVENQERVVAMKTEPIHKMPRRKTIAPNASNCCDQSLTPKMLTGPRMWTVETESFQIQVKLQLQDQPRDQLHLQHQHQTLQATTAIPVKPPLSVQQIIQKVKPVAQTCPGNLLFNPSKDQCDWPENVDCGDRVIPDPGQTPTPGPTPGPTPSPSTPGSGTCNCRPDEAPSICAVDGSDGVLVAHENCNQFYKCDNGKPVALYCFGNLLYNPYTEQCDWPENVDCGDRVIPNPGQTPTPGPGPSPSPTPSPSTPGSGTCNCRPDEAPSICAVDGSDGVLVAHENCNQFYKCDNGKPVALYCFGNLLYNPYTEQCDWPENVDCGDRVIPDPGQTPTPGPTPGPTPSPTPTPNPPGDNCDPSEAPTICAADNSEGVLVAHENCNQYYICSGSKPVDKPCPEISAIRARPISGTCNCRPDEAPSICAVDGSDGVLVAHENCNQFYKCDNGKPVALYCFGNLLYNPYTEQCDWPENVDCGDRVIPDPGQTPTPGPTPGPTPSPTPTPNPPGDNCDPSEAPTICAADNSEGVLVAHENCNQYYICSGSKPVAQTCPGNLLFNPSKDQCDWPENVDCGDRVIPDPGQTPIPPPSPTPSPSTPGKRTATQTREHLMCKWHMNNRKPSQSDNGKPVAPTLGNCVPIQQRTMRLAARRRNRSIRSVKPNSRPTPGPTPSPTPTPNPPGDNCDPSEAPTICAADNSEGVLVAHENCNQYYICSGSKPVAQTCPGNLLFNPSKDQCDWPENVDCGDRVIPDPGQTPIPPPSPTPSPSTPGSGTCNCRPDEAPSICAVDGSDGVLVAHENCNQFYKCSDGKPVALYCFGHLLCPSNLLYNPFIPGCDWAHNVDCGDRIIPDPDDTSEGPQPTVPDDNNDNVGPGPCNHCNPEEAPAICADENSNGIHIAHQNCNQFFVCDHGRPVTFSCNSLLLYNVYTKQCDWPSNVDCGDRVIPDRDNDSGNDSEENNNNNNEVYDDPSQAPTICAGSGSDGVLVAHEYCDQYYICDGGFPLSRPCHGSLLFNPQNQQCDWPNNVNCGNRIVPDDCACNPRNAPKLCSWPDSEGKLIAHDNCNQFYVCSNGVPVAQTCPSDLLYNIDLELCDWPHKIIRCDGAWRRITLLGFS